MNSPYFKSMITPTKSTRTTFYVSLLSVLMAGIVLCCELTALARNYCAGKNAINITVFIHGSLFTQLWPLDVKNILSGILPGSSPYVEIIKRARKNPLLFQDQALLSEGFVRVPDRVFDNFCNGSFVAEDEHKAAYLIAPAYHLFMPHEEHTRYVYYLFGHLCDLLARCHREYWHVTLTIVAHSHGGNIALNLVEAERAHKRGLRVDNVVMWGTPIQLETVAYAFDPMFKRVINCHSDGDWVQGIDTMSTKNRTCFKKLYDERLLSHQPAHCTTQVYDVRFMVNNQTNRIGHGNMWLLGREGKALLSLDPLPVMVVTPVLLDLLDYQVDGASLDCNITETESQLNFELLYSGSKDRLRASDNVQAIAYKARELTHKHWKSADKSRMVLLNYQTGVSLWQAVREWISHG
jgi:hypothetical protein